MTISPFDLILLLGATQGFILALLLWSNRKGNRLSNRLLAGLIGFMALMSFCVGIPIPNRYVSLFIDLVPMINAMPLGPLIYFYTKSVLNPDFRLGERERRQFYPIVLDWGGNLIAWTFVIGAILRFFPEQEGPSWGNVINEYNTYVDIPRWLSMTTYVVLAYNRLNAHSRSEREFSVRWLRQFLTILLVFQVIWLVHLVPYIIPDTRSGLLNKFGWYPIYIPITVMIYWLGLKGYLVSRNSAVEPVGRKTSPTTLPSETVTQVADSLIKIMESDKLYLDPELTVEKVARRLQVPARTISFVLNQHLQKSFNTFINEYRIEAVKQRLTDPASEHLTLTGIAFECGFNSQATFQRTFKQFTQLSPSAFMAQLASPSSRQ
ncbi:helix-turn-helix domain-containing protein [Spirosoma fluminis]